MDPKEQFYRTFQATAASLQEQINQLPHITVAAGSERQDAIESILGGISSLTTQVADASDYVPAYDKRTYSSTLKNLTENLEAARAKLAASAAAGAKSKGRFQFKPRSTPPKPIGGAVGQDARYTFSSSSNPPPNPAPLPSSSSDPPSNSNNPEPAGTSEGKDYNEEIRSTSSPTNIIRRPSFSAARDIRLSDHSDVHIVLPPSAANATSAGILTNLQNCVVDMSAPTTTSPFSSLALRNITHGLVIARSVSGSVHVTGVRNSVLVVVARQVRIHECSNTTLYLYCRSHPIIEDCSGMRFAPAPKRYLSEDEREELNQWDQVDDFKWLKAEHSPNWAILPEEERVPEEVWKTIGDGGDDDGGVDGILRRIGVGKETTT
ncbi:tubulin binding cofactor C-domain-containing protein [Diplogelasinospora grovesii]|uniref:Tubulin binding cofactor C-domain-containing protein n=1 Tax=Diplogelasinospora grovesii TaxID=303347 RepID=A0AAN6S660_9PEZI|nr:tubulin binding cofactor C-domain-containing protein [Diplogelasinospora grovesii]